MKKAWIAGVVTALSILGIVVAAQAQQPSEEERRQDLGLVQEMLRRVAEDAPQACVDHNGVLHEIDDVVTLGPLQFRCVHIFGERMLPKGVGWTSAGPQVDRPAAFRKAR